MMSRAYGNPLSIQDLGHVMGMYASDREAHDPCLLIEGRSENSDRAYAVQNVMGASGKDTLILLDHIQADRV